MNNQEHTPDQQPQDYVKLFDPKARLVKVTGYMDYGIDFKHNGMTCWAYGNTEAEAWQEAKDLIDKARPVSPISACLRYDAKQPQDGRYTLVEYQHLLSCSPFIGLESSLAWLREQEAGKIDELLKNK